MSRYLFLGIVCLAVSTAAIAFTALQYFQAIPEGHEIRLDWEVNNENGINRFEVYRKLEGEASFARIATVSPNGLMRYSYLDTDMFRNDQANPQKTIQYKLSILGSGGETAHYATVSFNPSAVQRSWGSIKSMFR